jgi:Protein of unknown function (DUF3592)
MRSPLTLRIRQHFDLFRHFYVTGLVICIVFCIAFALFSYRQQHFGTYASWPEVAATIQRSKINQVNMTSDTGPAWIVNVDMDLTFTANDIPIAARFVDSFNRTAGSEYASTLLEGNTIKIRYNPSNPHIVSLYPYLY